MDPAENTQPNPSSSPLSSLTGLVAVALIVIGVMALITPQDRDARLEGDWKTPDWELKDLNGDIVRSTDYEGKVVALDFWATWCGPCIQEIPSFIALQEKYGSEDFAVIGIALDENPATVKRFAKKRDDLNYKILIGDAKTQSDFGGIQYLPTTFLIGRDGQVAFKHVGLTPESTLEKNIQELLTAEE